MECDYMVYISTEKRQNITRDSVEKYLRETFGAMSGISSPTDLIDIFEDAEGKLDITYRFSSYTDPKGEDTDTLFAAQYDPEHGEIIDDIDITIADGYRGRGIGRRIVCEGLEPFVRSLGIPFRGLAVPASHGFWEQLGYEIVEHGDGYGLCKTATDGTPIAVLGEPYGESVDPEIEAMFNEQIRSVKAAE